jgi:hypothetical protein
MKADKSPTRLRVLSKKKLFEKMVRIAGLEPARVAPLPPQSSVSANSTISAHGSVILPNTGTEASLFGSKSQSLIEPASPAI